MRDIISTFITVLMYLLMYPVKSLVSSNANDIYIKQYKQLIFVSSHVSVLDPFIVSLSIPLRKLIPCLPVKIFAGNVFDIKFVQLLNKFYIIDAIYWLYGCIVVSRVGSTQEKLAPLQNSIKKGYSALIFPEGKINAVRHKECIRIKPGVEILRRTHPDVHFVYVKITRKGVFFDIKFSEPSLTYFDNYIEFVKDQIV